MKLKDMVDIVVNNDVCVVLKIKEGQKLNLIALGYFGGDEEMLRLTKGRIVHCTVFRTDGSRYAYHWTAAGNGLYTDEDIERCKIINECVEKDLGIKCLAFGK